jgi:hypothetical protein
LRQREAEPGPQRQQTTIYTKQANRKKIAGRAMHTWTPEEWTADESVHRPERIERVVAKTGEDPDKISA